MSSASSLLLPGLQGLEVMLQLPVSILEILLTARESKKGRVSISALLWSWYTANSFSRTGSCETSLHLCRYFLHYAFVYSVSCEPFFPSFQPRDDLSCLILQEVSRTLQVTSLGVFSLQHLVAPLILTIDYLVILFGRDCGKSPAQPLAQRRISCEVREQITQQFVQSGH